jgi:hypothetical protein
MCIEHVRAIIGLANLERDNATSVKINRLWLVNNQVDLDPYWTEYFVKMPESRCAGGR